MTALDFAAVQPYPGDPILGLVDRFVADPRPEKVNLAIGVYLDDQGQMPTMRCIRAAQQRYVDAHPGFGYLPMQGSAELVAAVRPLVLGAWADDERITTVQTVGGSGAVKLAAELLDAVLGAEKALVSLPTWENHRAILGRAGVPCEGYRYYDAATGGLDFEGMTADLRAAEAGTVVVLHGCCHNPTGVDLTHEQWLEVVEICAERELFPLVDFAYQGMADGLDADRFGVEALLRSGIRFMVASSASKNFGLYSERVGTLSLVCADGEESARVGSQLQRMVRQNYSSPPKFGAALVTTVLNDEALRADWAAELDAMRTRIAVMRTRLAEELVSAGFARDVSFVTHQRGMFTYTGLSAEQMVRLREEHGVYGLETGRICVSALNEGNLARVARALTAVD